MKTNNSLKGFIKIEADNSKAISKVSILLAGAILVSLTSMAQITKRELNSMPSPNAASLGIFGEFPAVQATGIPNITVPIYELRFRDVVIPINLQYNPQLLRPDHHPGWVGMGWNLSGGGAITRIKNDQPDELNGTPYSQNNSLVGKGYYYCYTDFQGDDWASEARVVATTQERDNNGGAGYYGKDKKPDEFSFSFLQYSGVFYLDENRKWKVRANAKLTVQVLIGSEFGTFKEFTLTDDKGNKYLFGGSSTTMERSQGLLGYDSEFSIDKTWHLSAIQLTSGEVISFTYETGTTIILPQLDWFNPNNGITGNRLMFSGTKVNPQYLKEISTTVQSVKFNRSSSSELKYVASKFVTSRDVYTGILLNSNDPGAPDFISANGVYGVSPVINNSPFSQLNTIEIWDKMNNKIINTYNLAYTNDVTRRLKLTGMTDASKRSWKFTYTDDVDPTLRFPDYFSNQMDRWGYYNGRDADYSSKVNYDYSKDPDPTKFQYELLSRIEYPTKGYTTYLFEPNDYSKNVDDIKFNPLITHTSNMPLGGVRIKEIKNFDYAGTVLNGFRYFYTQGYSSSGPTGLSSGVLSTAARYYIYRPPISNMIGWGDINSSAPMCLNNNGSVISYSKVAEVQLDNKTESLTDNSFTISEYSNFDNGNNNEFMDGTPAYQVGNPRSASFSSKSYDRGRLINRKVFQVNNNSSRLIKESSFRYQALNQNDNYVRSYSVDLQDGANSGNVTASPSALKIYTYPYVPIQSIEKIYDQFDPGNESKVLTTTTDYSYKNLAGSGYDVNKDVDDWQPRSITQSLPTGEKLITENKYVNDYPFSNYPFNTMKLAVKVLQAKGAYSTLIESVNSYTPSGLQTKYVTGGALNLFMSPDPNNADRMPVPWKSLSLKAGHGLIDFTLSASADFTNFTYDSRYKEHTVYSSYDNLGNPLSVTSADGILRTYTWINNNTLLGTSTLNSSEGALLQHQSIYTHDPLVGITSISDPNNRVSRFEYDSYSRLKIVKDHDYNITHRYRYNYKDVNETELDFSISGAAKTNNSITFSSVIDKEVIGSTTYVWDFGDGQVIENGAKTVGHSYSTPGNYTVKLSKVNPEYGSSGTSKPLVIYPLPTVFISPQIDHNLCTSSVYPIILASATTGCPGNLTYSWTYSTTPDGASNAIGSGESISIGATGGYVGTYYFRCTVTDSCGQSVSSGYCEVNITHPCDGPIN